MKHEMKHLESLNTQQQERYKKLIDQVDCQMKNCRRCSINTRMRYKEAMYHFCYYLVLMNKRDVMKMRNEMIRSYCRQMTKDNYSQAYMKTNLSAIRYFYMISVGRKFYIKGNDYFFENRSLDCYSVTGNSRKAYFEEE